MPLWKNHAFVDDDWRAAASETPVGDQGAVILTLAAWQAARDELAGTNQRIGVRIEPAEPIDAVIADLPRLSLVALSFPKFGDGRSFSKAKLLREDAQFAGEIRAVGDVLWDQLQLMARCGFDAFEIGDAPTLKALEAGKKPFMTDYYQPGSGPETRQNAPRAWARRALL